LCKKKIKESCQWNKKSLTFVANGNKLASPACLGTHRKQKKEHKMSAAKKSTKNTICPFCKEEVEQSGKGRPREFHDECRKMISVLSWLEDMVTEKIPKNCATKTAVKSNLFRIANLTSEWKTK
jgi:hypothetical protein